MTLSYDWIGCWFSNYMAICSYLLDHLWNQSKQHGIEMIMSILDKESCISDMIRNSSLNRILIEWIYMNSKCSGKPNHERNESLDFEETKLVIVMSIY